MNSTEIGKFRHRLALERKKGAKTRHPFIEKKATLVFHCLSIHEYANANKHIGIIMELFKLRKDLNYWFVKVWNFFVALANLNK